jgi:hypothetical protein
MARLRRMYARPLFVVVGISGPVLAFSGAFHCPFVVRKAGTRLGIAGACGYTLAP